MPKERAVSLALPIVLGHQEPAFFRVRSLGERMLVTNYTGEFSLLSQADLERFVRGDVDPSSELYGELAKKNLLRGEVDFEAMARRLANKKRFLRFGPNLHIIVLTLRCNETCQYCHASRADMSATETDMSEDTAQRVVDMIFQSSSPSLTIEFQGGEPLVNFEVLVHVVNYAREKNREAGKTLSFSLVSNLSLLDDDKAAFLLDNRVQICTSIDGPAAVHNRQRRLPKGDAWQSTVAWIEKLNRAYRDRGLDEHTYHVEALPTITRAALGDPEAFVDTFVRLGCKALFLRPLDPFGFAAKTGEMLGYGIDEYLAFYRRAVDYILELNRRGTKVLERYASIFLTKILSDEDPNYLDCRSPCGAGIGQIAYNYDGGLFPCDEGRMLREMGDDFFALGEIESVSYRDLVRHDTVRAMTLASNVDNNAGCATCAYAPYCGICPVYNYAHQGSLHGIMATSRWCATHMGIQDYLFEKLAQGDSATLEAFQNWITVRPREHYIHRATGPDEAQP